MLKKILYSGQSVVEIVVALAIFLIVVAGGVVTVVGSLSTGRLAKEETQAATYANEGLEAVDSIRNRDWLNLIAGDYGLAKTSGFWEFSGSEDTDPSGKFTRVVSVIEGERDVDGNLTLNGVTPDPDTFYVTSKVTWNYKSAQTSEVTLNSYLTNWQEGSSTSEVSGTPTPTLTPTPSINSCLEYCQSVSYSSGTCRRRPPDCTANGEVAESGGDSWCTGSNGKCCCLP